MFAPTFTAASGRVYRTKRVRTIPLVHPTTNGYVGFQLTTGQQWVDFCDMTDRPEWADDPTLTRFDARQTRYDEINDAVDAWTSTRTTEEIVELAVAFRTPVAPVGTGATIPQFEQCVERNWYVRNPRSGFLRASSRRCTGRAPHRAPRPRGRRRIRRARQARSAPWGARSGYLAS